MKPYDWNNAKNEVLKSVRSVSFEAVVAAIDADGLLAVLEHPNKTRYRHQKMYVVHIHDYAFLVPYVEDEEKIFLKTIIPSRKATRQYLTGEKS